MALAIRPVESGGNEPPDTRPMMTVAGPAIRPLSSTMWRGSDSDTFRVRLLSSPQETQAATIASGPKRLATEGVPDQARTAAPDTSATMPNAIRRSKLS